MSLIRKISLGLGILTLVSCGESKKTTQESADLAFAGGMQCLGNQWEAYYYYDSNKFYWNQGYALPGGYVYAQCINTDDFIGSNSIFVKDYKYGGPLVGVNDEYTVVFQKSNVVFSAPAGYAIYDIRAHFDDAVKFYVDDALMWQAEGTSGGTYVGGKTTTYVSNGTRKVTIKFNEVSGYANLNLMWTANSGGVVNPPVVVPPPVVYPPVVVPPTTYPPTMPVVPSVGGEPGLDYGPNPPGCEVTQKVRVCVKPQNISDAQGAGADSVDLYKFEGSERKLVTTQADWRNRGFVELEYKWNVCSNPNGEQFEVQRMVHKKWSQSGQAPYTWSHTHAFHRAPASFNSLRVYRAAVYSGGVFDMSPYLKDGLGCQYFNYDQPY
ncbi:MAG: hypothetical protein KBD78_07540 [Oligoflexales bacterium]|nr:hypothetical protein [Oligoflexales bacterium]